MRENLEDLVTRVIAAVREAETDASTAPPGVAATLNGLARQARNTLQRFLVGEEPRVLGYEDGVETIEECDGHAVFSGSEGEDPQFRALFADPEDARAFVALTMPDEPDCPRVFDPTIAVAVVTPQGIVASNDYKIETHEQLRARIAEARRER